MELKIIGGKFRGRKLKLSDDLTYFRPTKSMVREAVCSSISVSIAGAEVLELCAGSAVFSLELLSRGASNAVAVELDLERCKCIKQFSNDLNLDGDLTVFNRSVESYFSSNNRSFDIIFFDPPYKDNDLTDFIPYCLSALNDFGILVFEAASDDNYIEKYLNLDGIRIKIKKYGKSKIYYFIKEGD